MTLSLTTTIGDNMTTDDYMEENWNLGEHESLSVNPNFT